MDKIILLTQSEFQENLKSAVKLALQEFHSERASEGTDKVYTINQVSKKLGMSWSTINKLVDEGKLIATETKRIPESAIREFLRKQ